MTTDKNALPPVDEMPVLDGAADTMKMTLAAGASGTIYVFHEKPFPEPVNWVEYNADSAMLIFISSVGRMQPIGLKVPKQLANVIDTQNKIIVSHLVNGEEKQVFEMPLVRQKYA
ncbi:MAG: hypothetical protein ACRBDI_03240 [Alphaproteobacteria bacterium]